MKKVILFLVAIVSLSSCQKEDPYIGTYEGTYDIRIRSNDLGTIIDTTYDISVQIKQSNGVYYWDFPHGQEECMFADAVETGIAPRLNTWERDGKTYFQEYQSWEDGEVNYIIYAGYPGQFDTVVMPNHVNAVIKFEGYKQ